MEIFSKVIFLKGFLMAKGLIFGVIPLSTKESSNRAIDLEMACFKHKIAIHTKANSLNKSQKVFVSCLCRTAMCIRASSKTVESMVEAFFSYTSLVAPWTVIGPLITSSILSILVRSINLSLINNAQGVLWLQREGLD
jgi:hypothetical protein